MTEPLVEVVDPGDVDTIADSYGEILVPAFAPAELVDLDVLGRDMQAGTSELLVARDTAGEVLAAGVWDRTPGAEVALLSYLAARPGGRGLGSGGELLEAMLARWRRPSGPSVVLAEVHDPRHWPATGDERPSARLRFYARHGARLLDLSWIQPRITPGGDRVEGMLLLVLEARPPALVDGGAALDGALVRAWVEQQLRDAEGDAALADPGFAEIVTASRRPTIALLDLDVVAAAGPSLD